MLDKIHTEETTYKELSAALVAAAAEATRPEVELLFDDVHDHLLYLLHLPEKCTLPVWSTVVDNTHYRTTIIIKSAGS